MSNKDENNKTEKKYAFEGSVIRLTEQHFQAYKKTYHAIPDLNSVLFTLDAYYEGLCEEMTEDEIKKFKKGIYFRIPAALNKKHEYYLVNPPAYKQVEPQDNQREEKDWDFV